MCLQYIKLQSFIFTFLLRVYNEILFCVTKGPGLGHSHVNGHGQGHGHGHGHGHGRGHTHVHGYNNEHGHGHGPGIDMDTSFVPELSTELLGHPNLEYPLARQEENVSGCINFVPVGGGVRLGNGLILPNATHPLDDLLGP